MTAPLGAIAIWLLGALATWLVRGRPERAAQIGTVAAVAGAWFGAMGALGALAGGEARLAAAPWSIPFAALSLRLDPLGAAFLLPTCLVGALCALSGAGAGRDRHGAASGAGFAFYNLLLASLATVTLADNLVLLLAAWEAMT